MKKYSRAKLIRYFEKLPPRSRPCKEACPIATYLGLDWSIDAVRYDQRLAFAIDCLESSWSDLTAARIAKIAKAAPHV